MDKVHWRDPVAPPMESPVIAADVPSLFEAIRKRPRPRWRLYGGLLGLAGVFLAAGASLYYWRASALRQAPQLVLALNGQVRYQDERTASGVVIGLTFRGAEFGDEQLARLKPWKWHFPELRDLDLRGTAISDKGLADLPGEPLTTLLLDETSITDVGLAQVAELTSLRSLSLENTAIGDEGLRRLTALKGLTTLYLAGTRVSDAGLDLLAEFESLEYVQLDGRFSDHAVTRLQAAKPELRISR